MRPIRCLAILATGLLTHQAVADEIWDSEIAGRVIYEIDVDDTAVFSFESVLSDARANLYIPGLPGTLDNRGVYEGYWIDLADDLDTCGAALTGADGTSAKTWGAATVSFDDRVFPASYSVEFGTCFGGETFTVTATPTTDP